MRRVTSSVRGGEVVAPRDQGQPGEGLHVEDQRGAAVDAALADRRELGRAAAAGRPSSAAHSADSSPARYAGATGCRRTPTGSRRSARWRREAGEHRRVGGEVRARRRRGRRRPAPARRAPGAGRGRAGVASFAAAGSPSEPLATTTGAVPVAAAAAATLRSLAAVGNPAPPRPVSPASSTRVCRSTSGSGPCGREVVAERGPGRVEQAARRGMGAVMAVIRSGRRRPGFRSRGRRRWR